MSEDQKLNRSVFRDYRRGLDVQAIAERHELPVRQVNKIVEFESAVDSRVKAALERQAKVQERKAAKQAVGASLKPATKTSGKTQRREKG